MLQQDGTDHQSYFLFQIHYFMEKKLIFGLLVVLWESWLMDNHYSQESQRWTNFLLFKKYLDLCPNFYKRSFKKILDS